MKTSKLALLTILLVLVPAAAFAALSAMGPVIPYNTATHTGNGFPHYYTDANGVSADIQVPPFGDGLGILAPTLIFAPVGSNPLNSSYTPAMVQFSTDIGFDVECFYYYLQPDRTTFDNVIDPGGTGNGAVNIVIGLECGFATTSPVVGAPQDGKQAVFQRIRFVWKNAPIGTYRFTHPYGVTILTAVGSGIKATIDTPVAVAGDFTSALRGPISVFCQQLSPQPVINGTPPPGFNLPSDWLGDGVSPATFTGSPTGFNGFKLEAFQDPAGGTTTPNPIFIDPVTHQATNTITTDKAVIAGHKYTPPKKANTGALLLLLSD